MWPKGKPRDPATNEKVKAALAARTPEEKAEANRKRAEAARRRVHDTNVRGKIGEGVKKAAERKKAEREKKSS